MKYLKPVRLFILLAFAAGIFGFISVDDDAITRIVTALGKWELGHPQEKVYLHMDKPYYAIGDDIWFKAYVVTGQHQLSTISNVLNVELIDERDSIARAIKLPVINGLAWGDFKLTDSLTHEGNYRIRAYTNWMRNAGTEYFFDKTIQIGNAVTSTVFTRTSYTYAIQNNQQKVNAIINYADIDGKPYAAKEVSYDIELGNKSNIKGKGITDDVGNLNISFVNSSPGTYRSGVIVTGFKLDATHNIIKTVPIKAVSSRVDVQFFPESGNLVNGVTNRVAFKAVGADGLGVEMKGTVVDGQNNEIAKISTQHSGMGMFSLYPDSGKAYTAKLTYPDGSEGAVNLPLAAPKGYVLNVYNNNENDVVFRISTNQATLLANPDKELSIVAQSNGNVIYAAKAKLQSTIFSTKIPKGRFPTGIVQFTVFNDQCEPLNERIIFIQNPDKLKLGIKSDKQTYAPREKVKLDIEAKNNEGQPGTGSFSVAVTDESKVPVDESSESTILSNLLLTSDIKGYVEKPNYYFTNISDKTKADLDILMLTQGYRSFSWKQVISGNVQPIIFQPEKSLSVSGHLQTLGGRPLAHGKVSLISKKGNIFTIDTVADEQGRFTFNNLVIGGDSVRLIIQARTQKDSKDVQVFLDQLPRQLVSRNKNAADVEVNISTGMAGYLLNSKQQFNSFLENGLVNNPHLLSEVSVKSKKQPVINSDNLNGAGHADQIIKSEQIDMCPTLDICLTGKLTGVMFKNGLPYLFRNLASSLSGPPSPMTIVIDGTIVESDYFTAINPLDVENIEVLKSAAYTSIYGVRGGPGVLVITMKRGGTGSYTQYTPYIITYRPAGYYLARQFYPPRYDEPKTNAKVADLRTTIFWKPNVFTDKDGTKALTYFNTDNKGTYRAVVEGIDSEGNIARQVYRYKVE